MAIWNSAIIEDKVRFRLNKGFSDSKDDLLVDSAMVSGVINAPSFDKTVLELSNWLGVGRETVLRWYGFQRKATNRIVPKLAEGFSPKSIADEDTEIIDPFTGDTLEDWKREQLRIRVFLAAIVGHNEGKGGEEYEINWGLWREPLWTGKKRIYEKQFDSIRDAVEYGMSIWLGEDAYEGGQEGAYLYRAWYHLQLSFIPANKIWQLDIYCRDRGKSGGVDPVTGLPTLDESDSEETPTDEEGNTLE